MCSSMQLKGTSEPPNSRTTQKCSNAEIFLQIMSKIHHHLSFQYEFDTNVLSFLVHNRQYLCFSSRCFASGHFFMYMFVHANWSASVKVLLWNSDIIYAFSEDLSKKIYLYHLSTGKQTTRKAFRQDSLCKNKLWKMKVKTFFRPWFFCSCFFYRDGWKWLFKWLNFRWTSKFSEQHI